MILSFGGNASLHLSFSQCFNKYRGNSRQFRHCIIKSPFDDFTILAFIGTFLSGSESKDSISSICSSLGMSDGKWEPFVDESPGSLLKWLSISTSSASFDSTFITSSSVSIIWSDSSSWLPSEYTESSSSLPFECTESSSSLLSDCTKSSSSLPSDCIESSSSVSFEFGDSWSLLCSSSIWISSKPVKSNISNGVSDHSWLVSIKRCLYAQDSWKPPLFLHLFTLERPTCVKSKKLWSISLFLPTPTIIVCTFPKWTSKPLCVCKSILDIKLLGFGWMWLWIQANIVVFSRYFFAVAVSSIIYLEESIKSIPESNKWKV